MKKRTFKEIRLKVKEIMEREPTAEQLEDLKQVMEELMEEESPKATYVDKKGLGF
jgi:hypothetical protein